MERILEPEIMDDLVQAEAYARADFEAVNQGFVERYQSTFAPLRPDWMIDLGCGPADIPIRLARELPETRLVAVDASAAMLALARHDVARAGLLGRIVLVRAHLSALPLPSHVFDAVISNSLVHHLPDPSVFWRELQRLGRPGAAILVMDLFRPDTKEQAQLLVEQAAEREPSVLRRDFYNSLLSAFTRVEVNAQLDAVGLGHLAAQVVSERHWLVAGRLPGCGN
jgi:ubiquinone/menaquinone biosynthesis C-methylase UbiE